MAIFCGLTQSEVVIHLVDCVVIFVEGVDDVLLVNVNLIFNVEIIFYELNEFPLLYLELIIY